MRMRVVQAPPDTAKDLTARSARYVAHHLSAVGPAPDRNALDCKYGSVLHHAGIR